MKLSLPFAVYTSMQNGAPSFIRTIVGRAHGTHRRAFTGEQQEMSRRSKLFGLCLTALASLGPVAHASNFPGANSNIVPAAPVAKKAIDFDKHGFIIHGKRVFLATGEVQYNKIPRALWRDRLLRVKRAGYNCIQTYAYWNYHEPQEGNFQFTGEKDFGAFLKLVQEMGMYAIVRVGPYVCAEWDSGGYPVWLRFKPGLQIRVDEPVYMAAVDHWYDKIFSIVAPLQIHRGGPVVMFQLENEDTRSAGPELNGSYFTHLRDTAVRDGMQVPWFMSGVNHGDDPAGNDPWDSETRTSPWYSSEFWTGWIAFYGVDPGRAHRVERTSWKAIAYGAGGYTHYTMVGATNFDYWNDDEQASSYDFGAPVGQVGDFREDYYTAKRAAMFATSFSNILADSRTYPAPPRGAINPALRVNSREGKSGAVYFLDNRTGGKVTTQISVGSRLVPAAGPVTLAPDEILPVVKRAALPGGVTLDYAATHVLGLQSQGALTTMVVYGAPGDPAELQLSGADAHSVKTPKAEGAKVTVTAGHVLVQAKYSDTPAEFLVRFGPRTYRILVVTADMATRTWFLDWAGKPAVVCGPDYAGDVINGTLYTERNVSAVGRQANAYLYTETGSRRLDQPYPSDSSKGTRIPQVGAWSVARGDAEAQPGYNTSKWRASAAPESMGADGDISAYAWYRTTLHADKEGDYGLSLSDVGDWVEVFVNGARADASEIRMRVGDAIPRFLKVHLKAGDNPVAFLTAHYGRNKIWGYMGPYDKMDAKGISGPVTLAEIPTNRTSVDGWRYKLDPRGEAGAAEMTSADTSGAGWAETGFNRDVFNSQPGFAWFRTTLPDIKATSRRLMFAAVDDNAFVYLNGKRLKESRTSNAPFDVVLDPAWKDGGPNELAVLVENGGGPGGINSGLELVAVPGSIGGPIQGWKMRGGIRMPIATSTAWKPWKSGNMDTPSFYKTTFQYAPPPGTCVALRVGWDGMSRGSVWLNGHNLGRYPERSSIFGIYLPECWLKQGANSLAVFDEEGRAPGGIKIIEEAPASREVLLLAPSKLAVAQKTARK
jgi:beta-galactosidase